MTEDEFEKFLKKAKMFEKMNQIILDRDKKLFLSDSHYEELMQAKQDIKIVAKIIYREFKSLNKLQDSLFELEFPKLYQCIKISLDYKFTNQYNV